MLAGVLTDGCRAGLVGSEPTELGQDFRPVSASAPLQQTLPEPYLRCSGSCHGNWGRQYLRVAIRQQEGLILSVSGASVHWW